MLRELLNMRKDSAVKSDKIPKSPIVLALVVFLCVLLLVPSVVFAQDNINKLPRESINPCSLEVSSDNSQVAAFVTRFYQECLSRDPDSAGLNGWVDWLEAGAKTGADVAYGFVFSDEFIQRNVSNEQYVTILYSAFFGREPDSGGYSSWLNYLNTGKSRQWVLAGFINSQEFKNLCAAYGINPGSLDVESIQIASFVTRFYQECLSRDPDSAGLNTWVDWLESGAKTGADVAYGFVFSDEFIKRNASNEEYLTILYRAFFGREPDSAGYGSWLGYLNTGESRQWVLAGFINSQEFKNLCAAYGINPGTLIVEEKGEYINYINPLSYSSNYTVEIRFNPDSVIDSINAYIPAPSIWDSQKNVQLNGYTPGGVVNGDNLNNKYISYDKEDMSGSNLSMAENFSFTCYEIVTDLNIENIPPYDKNSSIYKLYTKDEVLIETNYFKSITPAIIGGETNVIKQSRAIYDYVISNMSYVPHQGDFLGGAKFAYENKGGECGEYSSLFVAMARSIGIPARPVLGFWAEPSYGSLHVWAEFYLQDIGWIPVDPTIGQQGNNKDYYFGNLDNKRLIMSKGYNVNLEGIIAGAFQTGAFWWYGTGSGPEFNFKYTKN